MQTPAAPAPPAQVKALLVARPDLQGQHLQRLPLSRFLPPRRPYVLQVMSRAIPLVSQAGAVRTLNTGRSFLYRGRPSGSRLEGRALDRDSLAVFYHEILQILTRIKLQLLR